MSNRIKLLPEIVANQIAAGEVVNAPSNVVKEMMENSLDAGARCVKVNYRNGGKDMIQIVDDGSGMSAIDARMAFDRHATSKIQSIEDVYALHTFGFRGEALASIAAVAEVELRTRREEDELGTLTTISGGDYQHQEPIVCDRGAQFTVRNLFYNVPSRRKFIDGDNSRLQSQIKQEFMRVALCNPDVAFELLQNDVTLYTLMPTSRRGRIVDVVGKHIKSNLLDVEVDTSVVRIEGYVGRPQAAKRRNNEQYLFVNGRYFYSQSMQRTILKCYDKLIPEGTQPSYFIYITVDPERVDVNVHPQKTTVKFADMDVILEILQAAVREALAKMGAVPMLDFSQDAPIDIPVLGSGGNRCIYSEPRTATNESYNPFSSEYIDPTAPMPDVPFTGFDVPYDAEPAPRRGVERYAPDADEEYDVVAAPMGSVIEYIDEAEEDGGELFDICTPEVKENAAELTFGEVISLPGGYALSVVGGHILLVHLARAEERLLYEDIVHSICAGAAPSQAMLFSEEMQLSNDEYELLEEHATEFAALGFDIKYRGLGAISVEGRPALIDISVPLDELLYELLHGIEDGMLPIDMERSRMAEIMARRGSRVYSRTVTTAEAAALLKRLEKCPNPSFTPSGKAILTHLTAEELKAKFMK